MEELLKALQEDDNDKINSLACKLLITSGGSINRAQVSEFQKYAPCRIYPVEQDSFGWLIGGINYNGKRYTFG